MSLSPSEIRVIIDARPRGPQGPLAGVKVLGRTVLNHLIDAAVASGRTHLTIHTRESDQAEIAGSIEPRTSHQNVVLALGPPPHGSIVLRTDRLYDPARLKRVFRSGQSPESAVVWRLDQAHGLAGADDEILRRRTYQPIGRFWAISPARALARLCAPTRIRPNHLTLISGGLMIGAAGLIAATQGFWPRAFLPSLMMALALVIDTADGHLARLQGTASRLGRWLDATLDELGDMALHAAVAWSSFLATGWSGWLVLGMVYAMFKYLFFTSNTIWSDTGKPQGAGSPATSTAAPGLISARSVRGLAHYIGHADVRWHAWILLAILGRLEIELIVAAIYFPARFVAGAWRKAGATDEQE